MQTDTTGIWRQHACSAALQLTAAQRTGREQHAWSSMHAVALVAAGERRGVVQV
jgi:hypothetical protein